MAQVAPHGSLPESVSEYTCLYASEVNFLDQVEVVSSHTAKQLVAAEGAPAKIETD